MEMFVVGVMICEFDYILEIIQKGSMVDQQCSLRDILCCV